MVCFRTTPGRRVLLDGLARDFPRKVPGVYGETEISLTDEGLGGLLSLEKLLDLGLHSLSVVSAHALELEMPDEPGNLLLGHEL